jgi:hypothetical protein
MELSTTIRSLIAHTAAAVTIRIPARKSHRWRRTVRAHIRKNGLPPSGDFGGGPVGERLLKRPGAVWREGEEEPAEF